MKNILTRASVGNTVRHKIYLLQGTKPYRKTRNQVYLLISVNFHAPRSGSVFPVRIRILIQDSSADPDPEHCFYHTEIVSFVY
jgi:hypothetical protein